MVPLLLLIVFGVITYGFLFSAQISLNSAARDAARAGVVKPLGGTAMTCAALAAQARANSTGLGVTPLLVAVTVTGPGGATCTLAKSASTATGSTTAKVCTSTTAGQLVVSLAYTAKSLVPLVPPQSANLVGKGSFQCEYTS